MLRDLKARIEEARATGTCLRVRGSGTKDFYGNEPRGEPLDTLCYSGIVDYEPTELVITARCGTSLEEIERTLAANDQMLAFEPPHFGAGATLGGCIATGLAGPRRANAGGVRDFVLGARLLDGRGRDLSFGGRVMKNVAGFDVSRLLVGSLGLLGVVLEVSLRVMPRPQASSTLCFELDQANAIRQMNEWAGTPLPLSASCWHDGLLSVRLEGAASAVQAAVAKLGGERYPGAVTPAGDELWTALREQTHPFFEPARSLWRLAVPSSSPPLAIPGQTLIEWDGAQRWLKTDADAQAVRAAVEAAGGHATLFRAVAGVRPVYKAFSPLCPALMRIHRALREAFDPHRIFDHGRLYSEL